MKRYLILFWLLVAVGFTACQTEEAFQAGSVGYLRVEVNTVAWVESKATVPENYQPTQLYVEIKNAAGTVVNSTDNYETNWKGKQLTLPAGSYTITASSNGFDGQASGFDIPYYKGSKQITIEAGKEAQADLICTLANVKVSVSFAETFQSAFQAATVTITSKVSGIATQQVTMGVTSKPIYVPEGDFSAKIEVTNKSSQTHSLTKEFTGVKARDHYQLNLRLADQGNASIKVEADNQEREFSFTFNVATQVATSLGVKMPICWSTFALLEGEVISSTGEMNPTYMTFEWKKEGAEQWTTLPAEQNGLIYTAKLIGLTPSTTYSYRMKYEKDSESYTSEPITFSTDAQTPLPNGKLDDWYKSGKTWYAISEADFASNNRFWDSSNPGSTTGAGAMVNVNPTTGNSTVVHTAGGQSAQLQSLYASAVGIGKFAAASLYAGQFNKLVGTNGAKIDFGRPFTARPTQLTGWYQYSTGAIDYCGSGQPANTVSKGDTDLWSAYVVLTTGTYQLDNTNLAGTAKDFNALLRDDNDSFVVAYGALPDAECVASSDWKKFTIDLTYKNLLLKPTHIIIVISSSKYGDYFTGSTSSLLYLDDMELIYGDDPKTK